MRMQLVLFFYDNEAILNSKDIRNIKWKHNFAKKIKRKIITDTWN